MYGAQQSLPSFLCGREPTFEVPGAQAIDHKQQSPCSPSCSCVWSGLVQQVSVSLLECLQRLVPRQRIGIGVVVRAIHDTFHTPYSQTAAQLPMRCSSRYPCARHRTFTQTTSSLADWAQQYPATHVRPSRAFRVRYCTLYLRKHQHSCSRCSAPRRVQRIRRESMTKPRSYGKSIEMSHSP